MKDLTEQIYDELNAQVVRMMDHSLNQASRIAELERQLQDHSAQAFSIGETYANALSRIAELEAQIAVKADTDKLREALKLAVRQNSCDMLMTGEEIRKCEAALNSTALQAPVREVPGWVSVEDRLPDSDPDQRVWATWTGAGNIELGPRQGEARFVASMGWQPIGHMGWDWNVSHWQPLPALPAAPVQPEGE